MDQSDDANSTKEALSLPEGVYPIPELRLPTCPWCRRAREQYCLLLYDLNGVGEFEVVCEGCSREWNHFVELRRSGVKRWRALADWGYRGGGTRRPDDCPKFGTPPSLGDGSR